MKRAAALFALASACRTAPPPYGEVLVVVDTDVPVPAMVSRLRVDLFTAEGVWFESRDYPARAAVDWPLSFSVWSDRDAARVRVRLRAFPEARTRAYRGERFVEKRPIPPPAVARDVATLCAPPELQLGVVTRLRLGPDAFFPGGCSGDREPTSAASARFRIDRADRYRAEVVFERTVAATFPFVRRSCSDPSTTIDCGRLSHALAPGAYDLLVTTDTGAGASLSGDVDVLVARADEFDSIAFGGALAPGEAGPRLLRDGDATPQTEPLPASAIDRIVDLDLRAGERASAHVVLRGACAGTMADLAGGRTCVATDSMLEAVAPLALSSFESRPTGVVGTFQPSERCARQVSGAICMPGGAFLLGDRDLAVESAELFAAPERPVRIEPFLIDRTEYSWKRLRARMAAGLAAPPSTSCAGPTDDDMPVTCVPWSYAREACRHEGGDLPTEAEWEWAASATVDRQHKQSFPWGSRPPAGCAAANVMPCAPDIGRVQRVDGERWASSDRTPFGVIGMVGNVREWTVDAAARFDAALWLGVPVAGASLDDPDAPYHVTRGLSYGTGRLGSGVLGRSEFRAVFPSEEIGFRCVYR